MINAKTYKTAMSKWLWVLLAAFLCLPNSAKAAEGFTNNELDTLVATIALYPDPLLVHVLTAATYGNQIPEANAWAQSHKNLNGEALATAMENANLKFDPSVQALIPFPTILETMAKYRTWSDQLGDAVSFQKDQVLDAIQRMRQTAYNYGHLKSDDQVVVTKEEKIIIEPTRTEYVYVPVYNPHVVYYVYADHYHPAVRYHHHAWLGTWYGEWGWGSCWFDWHSHFIYVRDYRWYPHRPIPHHPRRYSPPPRKPHHYRPAPPPPQKHRAEPPRNSRNDRYDRPSRDDHRVRREDLRPARREDHSRDVHSQAVSAKKNSLSVIKNREQPRRVEKAPVREESKTRAERPAPSREEIRRGESRSSREETRRSEPAPSRESARPSSERRSDSRWDDNSKSDSRRSSGSTSAVNARSNSHGTHSRR